jgi:atypical dual specificity phosphatase
MLELLPFRGTLSICGSELADHIQRLSPGRSEIETPHITVFAAHEVKKLELDVSIDFSIRKDVQISQESLQVLSVGQVKDVEYLVVSWPHAQLFRKKLGLEPKAFHITLSKVDRHDVSKDLTTTKGAYPAFVSIFRDLPEESMDYILADLLTTSWQEELCLEFLAKFETSYRACIRLADHVQHEKPHLATNAYARALGLNPALHDYVSKKLKRLAPQAPCGPFQVGCPHLSGLLFPNIGSC